MEERSLQRLNETQWRKEEEEEEEEVCTCVWLV